MIIHAGVKAFGRVDEVPGVFHVDTRCGHIYLLPVIPYETRLVVVSRGKAGVEIPIGFSFKSFAMAWLRIMLFVVALMFALLVLVIALDPHPANRGDLWATAVVAAILAAVWWYACCGKRCRRATYRRALELSERANVSDEVKVLIELHFARLTKEEADALLEQARLEAAEAPDVPMRPSVSSGRRRR